MNVESYNLHCSNCEPSNWVKIPADEVKVDVDLRTDEYIFTARCNVCWGLIHNKRRAFK